MIIDITDSKLHLLHFRQNGMGVSQNIETYWKIGNVYLYVQSYSDDRLKKMTPLQSEKITYYTIVDNYFKEKTESQHIFNILYKRVDWIESNILRVSNFSNKEFKINEHNIIITVIDEVPQKVSSSKQYSENMTKCIMKQRNLIINNIIN